MSGALLSPQKTSDLWSKRFSLLYAGQMTANLAATLLALLQLDKSDPTRPRAGWTLLALLASTRLVWDAQ